VLILVANFCQNHVRFDARTGTSLLEVVNDQIGSLRMPTDLAQIMLDVLTEQVWQAGYYHFQ
jgi:dTDP-4-dehydrorhamnose reductase